jgi:hypothetical protein
MEKTSEIGFLMYFDELNLNLRLVCPRKIVIMRYHQRDVVGIRVCTLWVPHSTGLPACHTCKLPSEQLLIDFGDGWSSPELEIPSLLHGFEVVNTLSELFEDDDDSELENSESEEESEAEDPSFRAALSRDSKSFLEGFEMRLIAVDNSDRQHDVWLCDSQKVLLSIKFAHIYNFLETVKSAVM